MVSERRRARGFAASLRRLGIGVLGVTLAACGGASAPPAEGPTLRDVQVPAGFGFSTSQTVALRVSAGDGALGGQKDAAVTVKRPDGVAVFKGAVRRGQALQLALPLALEHRALEVEVSSQGRALKKSVVLDKGAGAGSFE